MRTVRGGRRGAMLVLGALWWWGVLRLAVTPDAGLVEGAVAAGGWGLSLLPVHCVPKGRKSRTGGRRGRLRRSGGDGQTEVGDGKTRGQ